jgi:hypothetical protein
MNLSKYLWAIATACVIGNVQATPILDQVNDQLLNVGFNGISVYQWQQEVTAGIDGYISNVEVYLQNAGSITFSINLGEAWQTDANDFVTIINNSGMANSYGRSWVNVDISSAGIYLNQGDKYVIGLKGDGTSFRGSYRSQNYSGGDIWVQYLNDPPVHYVNYDMFFRTYVDAQIPEPSMLSLLGISFLGLVGVIRCRRN